MKHSTVSLQLCRSLKFELSVRKEGKLVYFYEPSQTIKKVNTSCLMKKALDGQNDALFCSHYFSQH